MRHFATNIFDRNAKRLQRSRAALDPSSRDYDYLKAEIAERLADRILVSMSFVSFRFVSFCFGCVLRSKVRAGHQRPKV